MKGFRSNIERDTILNNAFRKVLYTGKELQLVIMSLKPGEEIGKEMHEDADQFFRVEEGKCKAVVDEHEYTLQDGDVLLVPAGAKHNVINTGNEDLKLYTLYGPPQHKDGIIRNTKKEAEEKEESFDGKTTESGKVLPVL